MDPQNDSLNKKSENTIQNCQNLASSKQSYDNLEKIMREQLESLKNSANILRANGQQSNQNNEAIILNSRSNKIQIRQKSNIRTKIEQNQNQMIQIDEESQKKRANYQPPRKEISSNKINSINNDNSNCSNIFQVIKNDKENIRISAASQNREFAVQSKIEERLEEHYASQPSSLVQSPRRKKNNFVVGNYFVESRLNIDNTNKPYLFKRLKQQLENSKGFSFYQDTTEKKGNSSQSSTIQSNNCNNNSIIWNNNSQINGNTIRIRSKNQKDYFDINNIHTSISNNKSTLKSNRKEDMNNSLFSTLADSQLHQQYTRKRNSLYQNSHQNQQISNRITGDLYRDRDGSGLSNHNFYSIKNSVSQNSSQRRDSSSLTQRYPAVIRRNDNNQLTKLIQNENKNKQLDTLKLIQLKKEQEEQIKQQNELRKLEFLKKQKEIDSLFQTTKEELYGIQIEKFSSVGQHIYQQREKYFNQLKNPQNLQLPSKDNEPSPPQYTHESLAYATQGSQLNEPYVKVNIKQKENGEEKIKVVLKKRKKNSKKNKKKKKITSQKEGQEEKGNNLIGLKERKAQSRIRSSDNNYNFEQQLQIKNIQPLKNCIIKKKKVSSRYQEQNVKQSQELSKIDDMILQDIRNTDMLYSNNSLKDYQLNTFRALQNNTEQIDKQNKDMYNRHYDSAQLISRNQSEDYYSLKTQQQQKNTTNISRFSNKKQMSHRNPLSSHDKDDMEDLFDVKIDGRQNFDLFKIQSFPKINDSQEMYHSLKENKETHINQQFQTSKQKLSESQQSSEEGDGEKDSDEEEEEDENKEVVNDLLQEDKQQLQQKKISFA